MEVVMASSSTDVGVASWDLQTGAEHFHYKSCISPPHSLISVGNRFFAASQLRPSSSTFGSLLYWSWHKPQPEVKSFPAEPIKPLVSNREGTYIIGGGDSGNIYLWEVFTGRLLKKWYAHNGAVSCLTLSDDESLLISGAEDGGVKVWSLYMMFDDARRKNARHDHVHSFRDHMLRVTDVKSGHGGSNAVIISASEDQTCKVWSLATGKLLRNITFPSVIDAIAIDVGEYAFYAGGRDGKIYIVSLNASTPYNTDYGKHIIGSLANSSRAVTSLAFSADGISLVSGSEDGNIRIWDTSTRNIVRIRHAKGPVTNILITRFSESKLKSQAAVGRRTSFLPPPLEKYANSNEEVVDTNVFIDHNSSSDPAGVSYLTEHVLNNQIKEIQQQGSTTAAEMEVERLKLDCKRAMQMVDQWKKMYDTLHQFCVTELLDDSQAKHSS